MDNYIVIDVEGILEAYSNTPDWIEMVERKFLVLLSFYQKKRIGDEKANGFSGRSN